MKEGLEKRCTYHAPKEGQPQKYPLFIALALIVIILFAGGRESLAATATPAQAKYRIDFSAVTHPPSPTYVYLEKFKELAEKESNGRLDIRVYRVGQVGTAQSLPDQLRTGSLQMMATLTSYWTKWIPWFTTLDVPGIFKSYDQVWRVHDQWLSEVIGKEFDNLGLKVVGSCDVGFRWFLSKKVRVLSPDDLRGMKVRSMGSKLFLATWVAWGAKPAVIDYSESFQALEQGVVDGMDNAIHAVIAGKFNEVCKYVSGPNTIYSGNYPVINKAFFLSLPPDLQAIVLSSMKAATDWARAAHQTEITDSVQLLRKKGVTVDVLTPAQIQKFIDATQSIREKARQDYGPTAQMVLNRLATEK